MIALFLAQTPKVDRDDPCFYGMFVLESPSAAPKSGAESVPAPRQKCRTPYRP